MMINAFVKKAAVCISNIKSTYGKGKSDSSPSSLMEDVIKAMTNFSAKGKKKGAETPEGRARDMMKLSPDEFDTKVNELIKMIGERMKKDINKVLLPLGEKKIYEYRIVLNNKDPFLTNLAYVYPMEFDLDLFKQALNKFVGKHNYQDFTSKEEDEGEFIREIYEINVENNKDDIRVRFVGNGFMRYQIRNMIGASISVANKKESIEFIEYHLNDSKIREVISYKAPACGLYLVDVLY